MSYSYGCRVDRDSNAITEIDEENKTATTKGYVNGEYVEFDGGSSDFSIAEVTVINNTSGTMPNLTSNAPIVIKNDTNDFPACIMFAPMSVVGTTVTFMVPLYKGKCVWDSQSFVDAGNVSLSENIEDYYGQAYVITGDGTITIS